jgi:cell wall-associated NlpC family hydrolase
MKKLLSAAVVFWVLLPGLFVGLITAALSTTAAAFGATVSLTCGPGGPSGEVGNTTLDNEQMASAHTIIRVVISRGLPQRAAVISVAVALQESSLRNDLRQRDHDSIGLFQQRIQYYGAEVAGDPVKSTNAFLNKLVQQPNWQTRPLTEVAADVQLPREDLRGEYAKWEELATTVTKTYWTGPVEGTSPSPTGSAAPPGQLVDCTEGTDDPNLADGAGIPDGYQLPTDAQARKAVAFALAQLGKPYVWGAEGPDAYDCSGLMMAAWAHAGVAIPRVTTTQVRTGVSVPGLSSMAPGDLILIPGSNGTMSQPGHVGMYIGRGGDGKQYLVHAPHSRTVVKVAPVSNWAREIAAIRRPVDRA